MIWYIIGHSNNPLTRLTASSFFWLMILAYTCVIFTLAWPSSLDVIYKSAPSVSIIVANVCRLVWNRTHKAAVGKQVTIKRNPFEMSGFSLFCQMSETQRSAEYCTISVTKPLAVSYRSKDR